MALMMRATLTMVTLLVATLSASRADPALDFILQAFAAEESAPKKRAELVYRRGDIEQVYHIDRIMPDRLRLHLRAQERDQELYVIGDRMYEKTPAGWINTPAAPRLSTPVSVVGLFKNRLEEIKELDSISDAGIEQRVFAGTISWFAGRSRNQGEIRIYIETATGLPRRMRFKGFCGDQECSFNHSLSYDATLSIEAPVP